MKLTCRRVLLLHLLLAAAEAVLLVLAAAFLLVGGLGCGLKLVLGGEGGAVRLQKIY